MKVKLKTSFWEQETVEKAQEKSMMLVWALTIWIFGNLVIAITINHPISMMFNAIGMALSILVVTSYNRYAEKRKAR